MNQGNVEEDMQETINSAARREFAESSAEANGQPKTREENNIGIGGPEPIAEDASTDDKRNYVIQVFQYSL